ncbi:hypothetical protein PHYBOEH_003325 [Phytophthora boehmeriae]|uniref:BRCT domain-containing protein n=1 Tax=Phytophthora boehmeriae TaxID=109152 RepID=A0A8T1WVQ6_9STRA|nr:hypothetical protein PHYBOEH_003325 [Phytophthora boehmeriae]
MDAFVKRQLFVQDVAFLVEQAGDRAADGDAAKGLADLRALLQTHGGAVVDESDAQDSRVTVVLLPDGSEDEKMLRLRFPKAEILRAQWLKDCVAKNRRLATATYRVATATCTGSSGTLGTGTEAPPLKKQKVNPSGDAVTTDVELPEPQLRPWKVVQKSLHVLDARAEQTKTRDAKAKIASFDLDGTIIVTKSGKRFAKDKDDWKWFHPTLARDKLVQLTKEGYTLVIFSNQNGIAKGNVSATEVQTKVEAIVKSLNLPMLVYLGTESDMMRKPRLGAWQEMTTLLSAEGEEAIDMQESFYCGDAAGRPKIAGRTKDFAATDYKFALNIGIRFYTPEDLFLGSKQRIHTRPDTWELGFDPKSIVVNDSSDGPVLSPASARVVSPDQEMVVLVGPPASGKSFFAKTHFSSYALISQDELRTATNCKKKCLEALKQKKSVVIDNTNREPRTRKEWITIAQQQGIPIRCFEMDVDKPLSMHLNVFRSLTEQKKIPDVAIHGFFKNFVSPTVKEGFSEVVKVQFRIDKNAPKSKVALLQSYL